MTHNDPNTTQNDPKRPEITLSLLSNLFPRAPWRKEHHVINSFGGGGYLEKGKLLKSTKKIWDIRKTINKYQYFENVIAKTRNDTKRAHQQSKLKDQSIPQSNPYFW